MIVKDSEWPVFELVKFRHWEKFEQEAFFRDLKITKIEWAAVATICTLRFTFSNGTSSVAFGSKY